jgi:Na+/proline symporter
MLSDLDWYLLFFGIAFILAMGLFGSAKIKNEDHYLLLNRKVSLFALVATLVMTELNPSSLISFAMLAYSAGLRGVFAPVIFLIGIAFYGLVVAKKYKEYNMTSIGEIFTYHYGSYVGRFASLSLLFAMCGFCATYVKALVLMFIPLFPSINEWTMSALIVILVLAMTLRGGLFSIIRIDIISFIFILVGILGVLFFAYFKGLGQPILSHSPFLSPSKLKATLPFSFLSSLIVLTSFTYILAPWYAQKIFSADTKKTAFCAAMIASVIVFALYTLGGLGAFLYRLSGHELADNQFALTLAIAHMAPSGLRGIIFFIFFIAGATTLCGVWSAMSSMVIADFIKKKKRRSFVPSLIGTLFFALSSFILSNVLIDSVFQKMILANVFVFALSFALLGAFYWQRVSQTGAVSSIVIGLFWGFFCYFYFGEEGMYTWYWVFYGLPLIFGFGILGSLLFPKRLKVAKV